MQETYSDSSSEKQKHSIGDILKKGFFFEGICTLKRYWIHCLISILITLMFGDPPKIAGRYTCSIL